MKPKNFYFIATAILLLSLLAGFEGESCVVGSEYDIEYYDEVSEWITKFGGQIDLAEGVSLYFGQNSLKRLTKISGQVAKLTNKTSGEVSFTFELAPHGVEFDRQAYIFIDVDLLGENFDIENVSSYLWLEDDNNESWDDGQEVSIRTLPNGREVLVIPLEHFSSYAIGKIAPHMTPKEIFYPIYYRY